MDRPRRLLRFFRLASYTSRSFSASRRSTLMLEAIDLLLKKRGQPSIKKLMGS
jgi:hypothetical protein